MRDRRIGVTSTFGRDASLNRQPCNRAWRPVGFTSAVSRPALMDECKIDINECSLHSCFHRQHFLVCDAHPLHKRKKICLRVFIRRMRIASWRKSTVLRQSFDLVYAITSFALHSHVPVCETRRVAVSLHGAWDGLRRWDPSYSDGRISERMVSSEQLLNRGPKNSGLPQNISKRKTQPMISA